MNTFTVDRKVRTGHGSSESEHVDYTVLALTGPEAARVADHAKATEEARRGLVKAPDDVPSRLTQRIPRVTLYRGKLKIASNY